MSHLVVVTTFSSEVTTFSSEVTTFSSEKASGLPVSGYGILLVTLSHCRGNMPLKTTLRVVSTLPQNSLIYTGNIAIFTISTVLPWLPSFQSCCATWYDAMSPLSFGDAITTPTDAIPMYIAVPIM